jgi:hypothetical protein
LSARLFQKYFQPPCIGSAASTSLSPSIKTKHREFKVKNAHPSAGDVHCSVPIEDPKHNTRNSDTLEQSDVSEHYIHLFFGIQEVSNAGPNHSLFFRESRKRWCSDVAYVGKG